MRNKQHTPQLIIVNAGGVTREITTPHPNGAQQKQRTPYYKRVRTRRINKQRIVTAINDNSAQQRIAAVINNSSTQQRIATAILTYMQDAHRV